MNGRQPAAQLVRQLNTKLSSPSVQTYIRQSLPETIRATLSPERMAKMVIGLFSRTPALHACSPDSIIRAVVECANLGLEPTGGTYTQVYLVPFKDQCQVIVSRYGLIEMARRAGGFKRLETGVIRKGDVYEYSIGDNGTFYHRPNLESDGTEPMLAAYCVAYFADGERSVCVMPRAQIEMRRKASKSGASGMSPWKIWPDEMAIKTVVKYAAKNWPLSVDREHARKFERAVTLDEGEHQVGAIDATLELTEVEPTAPPRDKTEMLADKIRQHANDEEREISADAPFSDEELDDSAPREQPEGRDA